MNTPSSLAAPTKFDQEEFDLLLAKLTQAGWQVTSDGPTGLQLVGEKRMRALDQTCLVVGLFTALLGFGLVLISIALIDFYMMKPRTVFVKKSSMEDMRALVQSEHDAKVAQRKTRNRAILLGAICLVLMVAAFVLSPG